MPCPEEEIFPELSVRPAVRLAVQLPTAGTKTRKETTMKILLAASMALMMAGASFAQETSSTSASDRGGSDPANYLNSPSVHQFYTDDSMTTLRSKEEIKAAWEAMSEEDQASLSTACEANTDPNRDELCLSMRTN
jgi:hypothetical protein